MNHSFSNAIDVLSGDLDRISDLDILRLVRSATAVPSSSTGSALLFEPPPPTTDAAKFPAKKKTEPIAEVKRPNTTVPTRSLTTSLRAKRQQKEEEERPPSSKGWRSASADPKSSAFLEDLSSKLWARSSERGVSTRRSKTAIGYSKSDPNALIDKIAMNSFFLENRLEAVESGAPVARKPRRGSNIGEFTELIQRGPDPRKVDVGDPKSLDNFLVMWKKMNKMEKATHTMQNWARTWIQRRRYLRYQHGKRVRRMATLRGIFRLIVVECLFRPRSRRRDLKSHLDFWRWTAMNRSKFYQVVVEMYLRCRKASRANGKKMVPAAADKLICFDFDLMDTIGDEEPEIGAPGYPLGTNRLIALVIQLRRSSIRQDLAKFFRRWRMFTAWSIEQWTSALEKLLLARAERLSEYRNTVFWMWAHWSRYRRRKFIPDNWVAPPQWQPYIFKKKLRHLHDRVGCNSLRFRIKYFENWKIKVKRALMVYRKMAKIEFKTYRPILKEILKVWRVWKHVTQMRRVKLGGIFLRWRNKAQSLYEQRLNRIHICFRNIARFRLLEYFFDKFFADGFSRKAEYTANMVALLTNIPLALSVICRWKGDRLRDLFLTAFINWRDLIFRRRRYLHMKGRNGVTVVGQCVLTHAFFAWKDKISLSDQLTTRDLTDTDAALLDAENATLDLHNSTLYRDFESEEVTVQYRMKNSDKFKKQTVSLGGGATATRLIWVQCALLLRQSLVGAENANRKRDSWLSWSKSGRPHLEGYYDRFKSGLKLLHQMKMGPRDGPEGILRLMTEFRRVQRKVFLRKEIIANTFMRDSILLWLAAVNDQRHYLAIWETKIKRTIYNIELIDKEGSKLLGPPPPATPPPPMSKDGVLALEKRMDALRREYRAATQKNIENLLTQSVVGLALQHEEKVKEEKKRLAELTKTAPKMSEFDIMDIERRAKDRAYQAKIQSLPPPKPRTKPEASMKVTLETNMEMKEDFISPTHAASDPASPGSQGNFNLMESILANTPTKQKKSRSLWIPLRTAAVLNAAGKSAVEPVEVIPEVPDESTDKNPDVNPAENLDEKNGQVFSEMWIHDGSYLGDRHVFKPLPEKAKVEVVVSPAEQLKNESENALAHMELNLSPSDKRRKFISMIMDYGDGAGDPALLISELRALISTGEIPTKLLDVANSFSVMIKKILISMFGSTEVADDIPEGKPIDFGGSPLAYFIITSDFLAAPPPPNPEEFMNVDSGPTDFEKISEETSEKFYAKFSSPGVNLREGWKSRTKMSHLHLTPSSTPGTPPMNSPWGAAMTLGKFKRNMKGKSGDGSSTPGKSFSLDSSRSNKTPKANEISTWADSSSNGTEVDSISVGTPTARRISGAISPLEKPRVLINGNAPTDSPANATEKSPDLRSNLVRARSQYGGSFLNSSFEIVVDGRLPVPAARIPTVTPVSVETPKSNGGKIVYTRAPIELTKLSSFLGSASTIVRDSPTAKSVSLASANAGTLVVDDDGLTEEERQREREIEIEREIEREKLINMFDDWDGERAPNPTMHDYLQLRRPLTTPVPIQTLSPRLLTEERAHHRFAKKLQAEQSPPRAREENVVENSEEIAEPPPSPAVEDTEFVNTEGVPEAVVKLREFQTNRRMQNIFSPESAADKKSNDLQEQVLSNSAREAVVAQQRAMKNDLDRKITREKNESEQLRLLTINTLTKAAIFLEHPWVKTLAAQALKSFHFAGGADDMYWREQLAHGRSKEKLILKYKLDTQSRIEMLERDTGEWMLNQVAAELLEEMTKLRDEHRRPPPNNFTPLPPVTFDLPPATPQEQTQLKIPSGIPRMKTAPAQNEQSNLERISFVSPSNFHQRPATTAKPKKREIISEKENRVSETPPSLRRTLVPPPTPLEPPSDIGPIEKWGEGTDGFSWQNISDVVRMLRSNENPTDKISAIGTYVLGGLPPPTPTDAEKMKFDQMTSTESEVGSLGDFSQSESLGRPNTAASAPARPLGLNKNFVDSYSMRRLRELEGPLRNKILLAEKIIQNASREANRVVNRAAIRQTVAETKTRSLTEPLQPKNQRKFLASLLAENSVEMEAHWRGMNATQIENLLVAPDDSASSRLQQIFGAHERASQNFLGEDYGEDGDSQQSHRALTDENLDMDDAFTADQTSEVGDGEGSEGRNSARSGRSRRSNSARSRPASANKMETGIQKESARATESLIDDTIFEATHIAATSPTSSLTHGAIELNNRQDSPTGIMPAGALTKPLPGRLIKQKRWAETHREISPTKKVVSMRTLTSRASPQKIKPASTMRRSVSPGEMYLTLHRPHSVSLETHIQTLSTRASPPHTRPFTESNLSVTAFNRHKLSSSLGDLPLIPTSPPKSVIRHHSAAKLVIDDSGPNAEENEEEDSKKFQPIKSSSEKRRSAGGPRRPKTTTIFLKSDRAKFSNLASPDRSIRHLMETSSTDQIPTAARPPASMHRRVEPTQLKVEKLLKIEPPVSERSSAMTAPEKRRDPPGLSAASPKSQTSGNLGGFPTESRPPVGIAAAEKTESEETSQRGSNQNLPENVPKETSRGGGAEVEKSREAELRRVRSVSSKPASVSSLLGSPKGLSVSFDKSENIHTDSPIHTSSHSRKVPPFLSPTSPTATSHTSFSLFDTPLSTPHTDFPLARSIIVAPAPVPKPSAISVVGTATQLRRNDGGSVPTQIKSESTKEVSATETAATRRSKTHLDKSMKGINLNPWEDEMGDAAAAGLAHPGGAITTKVQAQMPNPKSRETERGGIPPRDTRTPADILLDYDWDYAPSPSPAPARATPLPASKSAQSQRRPSAIAASSSSRISKTPSARPVVYAHMDTHTPAAPPSPSPHSDSGSDDKESIVPEKGHIDKLSPKKSVAQSTPIFFGSMFVGGQTILSGTAPTISEPIGSDIRMRQQAFLATNPSLLRGPIQRHSIIVERSGNITTDTRRASPPRYSSPYRAQTLAGIPLEEQYRKKKKRKPKSMDAAAQARHDERSNAEIAQIQKEIDTQIKIDKEFHAVRELRAILPTVLPEIWSGTAPGKSIGQVATDQIEDDDSFHKTEIRDSDRMNAYFRSLQNKKSQLQNRKKPVSARIAEI